MTAIEFENISKQYRLGLVSTKTLSHDINFKDTYRHLYNKGKVVVNNISRFLLSLKKILEDCYEWY